MIIKKREINPLDKKAIDNLRCLSIDMINEAKSGHPGICLGSAPILYTLYSNHLKFDPNNDKWINRDRFIMSAGHGSALLYSIIYMSGFNLSLDELKRFRKIDSITPGHPELNVTPGVDISTGPLGQGIANAVGIAISEKYLNKTIDQNVIDFNTYVFCGDGDLMEGISYEAISLAGTLKLNKLILLHDSNNITLDGKLENSYTENTKLRFEAMNWNVISVLDGEDINSINDAIIKAKTSDKPTLIEIKTIIGKYSENEGTEKVHGAPLSEEDIKNIKEKLNIRDIPFQVSDEAVTYLRDNINKRNSVEIEKWMNKVTSLNETEKTKLDLLLSSNSEIKLKDMYYKIPDDGLESTRVTSGKIINAISDIYPFFIGGSCDVSKSTYAKINDNSLKYIDFGIREHAAGAIANGIASTNVTPFVSTFLSFSDYMKPAIRMSAMMNLPVIYVFSHDSITVGEDGPTHQPIEQLISLRSIPNLDVYRPADANEVLGCYKNIFETRKPSVIILGRNKVPLQENTKVNDIKNGAYIVKDSKNMDGILIATGGELDLALQVSDSLLEKGIDLRVVSMPSIEVFKRTSKKYQNEVLPKIKNTFVIEPLSSYSWDQFVEDRNHLFTIDCFGVSGNYNDVMKKYNFTKEYIENKIEELLK